MPDVAGSSGCPPNGIGARPRPGIVVWLAHLIYDAAWLSAGLVALPWLIWRSATQPEFAETVLSRAGWKSPALKRTHDRPRILIHGVSVGEVKCAEALVRALERERPDHEIVISTTTATGAAMAHKLYPTLAVVRFPFDVSFVTKRFLERVDPAWIVLVELEVWPNFLRAADRRGVPIAVVNGRITARSCARYGRLEKVLPQFDRLTLICAQDEDHAQRFRRLSVSAQRVIVTGNLKYDALKTLPVACTPELRAHLGPRSGQLVFVAGSTHAPEELIVARAWRDRAREARLVIVPRHVERSADIAREIEGLGRELGDHDMRAQLLSRLRAGEVPDPSRPVIVDSIGELEQIYALADLVLVGGSLMSRGGQNVLEPAAQGKPVMHGPHMQNFAREAALLEAAGASTRVEDVETLAAAIERLLASPGERLRLGQAGREAVLHIKGASQRTIEALSQFCFGPA